MEKNMFDYIVNDNNCFVSVRFVHVFGLQTKQVLKFFFLVNSNITYSSLHKNPN